MGRTFEELDVRSTVMGEISLRRRLEPALQVDVYEAKLGDEFLMSSLFTASETALADLPLGRLEAAELDVVVGGLGLGYTASAVLRDDRVRSLCVVEALAEVIGWHRRGLLPTSETLTSDPRCRLVHGDFFEMVAAGSPFAPGGGDRHDAVLVDIDHTPRHLLRPSHASFYGPEGQQRVAGRVAPEGVYALWSDDPPDETYLAVAEGVFASVEPVVVSFPNPLTRGESACTIYLGRPGG